MTTLFDEQTNMITPRRKKACHKFTHVVAEAILFDVMKGSPLSYACVANGIGQVRMRKIVRDGNSDLDNGFDTDYAYFVRRLKEIQQSEIQDCRLAAKSAEKGHRGAEWTLERVYQKEFGSNADVREMAEQIEEIKRLQLATINSASANSNQTEEDSAHVFSEEAEELSVETA